MWRSRHCDQFLSHELLWSMRCIVIGCACRLCRRGIDCNCVHAARCRKRLVAGRDAIGGVRHALVLMGSGSRLCRASSIYALASGCMGSSASWSFNPAVEHFRERSHRRRSLLGSRTPRLRRRPRKGVLPRARVRRHFALGSR